jgi:hypothetical protein
MTDMQISLPILIVRPSIINPVINFSTHLWPVKWNALGYTFELRIPFLLLQCQCNTCTNMINNDMIYSISSRDHIGSSILTQLALHHCFDSSAPSHHSTCPSHTCNRSIKPSLVLIFSTLVTRLNACLICNELLHHMCELCIISEPFSHSWHMLLTHMYLWTNHMCILYLTQLVHLGCHSITKTKKWPFNLPPFW